MRKQRGKVNARGGAGLGGSVAREFLNEPYRRVEVGEVFGLYMTAVETALRGPARVARAVETRGGRVDATKSPSS